MTAALLSGLLTGLILSRVRIRPDLRLRDRPADTRARVRGLRRRRRPPGPSDLASWCDSLARDVRAGATLGSSLRSIEPPDGSSLTGIGHRLRRGAPLLDALDTVSATADEQAVITVLTALAQHGGPAAHPLDRVAATLRRRAADADERAVHSAQARLSALVMTVLPAAVLVLLLATSNPVRGAVRTPVGAVVVVIGLGLNAVGWTWMRRLVGGRPR